MGCLNSKAKPIVVDNNHYSWSDKDKVDPKDYTIANVKYDSVIKRPGDIAGQQFIVENCDVVLRNCISCRIMCCSQQFRSRDCKNIEIFLYCTTQPAIESCYDLTFGCFSANYKGLEDQFKKANLCVLNNNWTNIYDFTLNDEEQHWSLFSNTVKAEDYFSGIPSDNDMDLSFNWMTSVVPKTLGSMPTANGISGELCLILIIAGEQTHKTAIDLNKEMQTESEV
ncbi:unnamed protein product [Oppiella nova]|uniref:C-CAP/cofactor C-like domain-containing protein n=1 Tax=Oppiella nova TaxID=334625 RepID=A0A7R9QUZ6_9ACAR|nr:unnamed protein product [Oppiella nova]CAG2176566.1 unnamed protein product [Oppiella nova]